MSKIEGGEDAIVVPRPGKHSAYFPCYITGLRALHEWYRVYHSCRVTLNPADPAWRPHSQVLATLIRPPTLTFEENEMLQRRETKDRYWRQGKGGQIGHPAKTESWTRGKNREEKVVELASDAARQMTTPQMFAAHLAAPGRHVLFHVMEPLQHTTQFSAYCALVIGQYDSDLGQRGGGTSITSASTKKGIDVIANDPYYAIVAVVHPQLDFVRRAVTSEEQQAQLDTLHMHIRHIFHMHTLIIFDAHSTAFAFLIKRPRLLRN